ncbi:MAG TPA: hypothetical protein DCQ39_02975 [Lachnospiraceae bacterium]|nr:hypothetical protein [Lachnospiraceae bacterium]HAP72740.1 hypothetical protein [Lachnospiraceae bacterium]
MVQRSYQTQQSEEQIFEPDYMERQDFPEAFIKRLMERREEFPRMREMTAEYNSSMDAVRIGVPGACGVEHISLPVEPMYQLFLRFGWEGMFIGVRNTLNNIPLIGSFNVTEEIQYYEHVKNRLFIRAVNIERNREKVRCSCHAVVNEIALCVYLHISKTETTDMSIVVPEDIITGQWHKDPDDLFREVLCNMSQSDPARLYYSDDPCGMDEMDDRQGEFMEQDRIIGGTQPFNPVLTTLSRSGGATALFYPGVARRIRDILGEDYYIVFTSAASCMIHRMSDTDYMDIRERLKILNETSEADADAPLARRIYYYSGATGRVRPFDIPVV